MTLLSSFYIIHDLGQAVDEASLAIAADGKYAKAYVRRGDSQYAIGGIEELQKAIM